MVAGGGTATLCASAPVLFEFLPAADMLRLAEAILRVYQRLGDYEHRKRNRMKFLIRALGWEAWKAAVESELAAVLAEGGPDLPFDPQAPPEETAPLPARHAAPDPRAIADAVATAALRGPGLRPSVAGSLQQSAEEAAAWRAPTCGRRSRPAGPSQPSRFRSATSPARSCESSRTSRSPSATARCAPPTTRTCSCAGSAARTCRRSTSACGPRVSGQPGAGTIADVTSCPGAESCRLAVTQSRGLGRLLRERLEQRADLAALAPGLDLKISGCPNGCGQHHVAGIGFQGSVRQVGGRALPQYFLMLGGGLAKGRATFGRLAAKVPARRVPEAVERLLALYAAERRHGETARAFLQRVDLARVKALLADLEGFSDGEAGEDDFVDLGDETSDEDRVTPTVESGAA